MTEKIKLGKYRHYKGNEYTVIGVGRHSETLEDMVIYRAEYGDGDVWVRPLNMWFDTVIKDGNQMQRFTYVGE